MKGPRLFTLLLAGSGLLLGSLILLPILALLLACSPAELLHLLGDPGILIGPLDHPAVVFAGAAADLSARPARGVRAVTLPGTAPASPGDPAGIADGDAAGRGRAGFAARLRPAWTARWSSGQDRRAHPFYPDGGGAGHSVRRDPLLCPAQFDSLRWHRSEAGRSRPIARCQPFAGFLACRLAGGSAGPVRRGDHGHGPGIRSIRCGHPLRRQSAGRTQTLSLALYSAFEADPHQALALGALLLLISLLLLAAARVLRPPEGWT